MSRIRSFPCRRRCRAAIGGLLFLSITACAMSGPVDDAPLAVVPVDEVAPDPPPSPTEPPSPGAGSGPAAFHDAVAAVFERASGGVDRESWLVEWGVRVELFTELRWADDSGTVRTWLETGGEGLDTPEGRAVVASLDDWSDDVVLEGAELRRVLDGARAQATELLDSVGALAARGDGWWRGLGGGGFVDVGIHVVDGMADRIEYAQVGTLGDYWDVVG